MQVVLPLLQNEVVTTGWVSLPDFLTGLALVQAMPGPLFNFAAYLGTHSSSAPSTSSQDFASRDFTALVHFTLSKHCVSSLTRHYMPACLLSIST